MLGPAAILLSSAARLLDDADDADKSNASIFFESFVGNFWVILLAGGLSAIAISISVWNIYLHLAHYSKPHLQRSVVRILIMVPLYALFAFLALVFTHWQLFLDSLRNVYEAFVVYCFLNLMLNQCGGESECVSVIMNDPGSVSHAWPFNYCLPRIALSARFLRLCKQLTLQFVIVKPIMAILQITLHAVHQDGQLWNIFEAIVYNLSYTLALYALILFYKATRHHPGLIGQYPVLKFLSMKLVVFATYYQTMLIEWIPSADVSKESLGGFNNFLLCCEMVVFAIIQYFAYSYKPFVEEINTKSATVFDDHDLEEFGIAIDTPSHMKLGRVFNKSSKTTGKNSVKRNAKEIINVKDVATDAYHNFYQKYGDHVLLDSDASPDGIELSSDNVNPKISSQVHEVNPFQDPEMNMGSNDPGFFRNPTGVSGGESFKGVDLNDDTSSFSLSDMQRISPSAASEGTNPDGFENANPFEKDIDDPLHVQRRHEAESTAAMNPVGIQRFELTTDGPSGGWTADFESSKSQGGGSKKKKGKKRENHV